MNAKVEHRNEDVELTAALDALPPVDEFPTLARGASLGRYSVLDVLGKGGMGTVYSAYDPELDRRVAVKLLHLGANDGSAGRTRLLREAQAMAKLSHPNVLTVHDVGTLSDGSVYLALDLVDGQTLRRWLEERPRTWGEVKSALEAAGEGLWAAHQAGLVHRDFKPDNVLVRRDGRIFVTDFGLAKADADGMAGAESEPIRERDTSMSSLLRAELTDVHHVVGTPGFMAPEQFRGAGGDTFSDQFSFGVTLYQALYGERPFDIAAKGAARWQLKGPPKGVDVPLWLRQIALRCLANNPSERFPDMGEVLAALSSDPARKRKVAALWAAAVAAPAVVGAGVLHFGTTSEPLCEGVGQAMVEAWNNDRAMNIRAAFASTGERTAEDTYARVKQRLDGYATSWQTQRQQACEATRVTGEQSDEDLSLRMHCLDERLEGFNALVGIFEQAEPDTLSKAVQASYGLGELRDCKNLPMLRLPIKPPSDPEKAAEVQAIREGLARVDARILIGQLDVAQAELLPLLARARASEYRPVEAEALLTQGTLLRTQSDPKASEVLDEALWVAQAGRADEVAARAIIDRISHDGSLLRMDEVARRIPQMNALVERLGNPDHLRWESLILTGGRNESAEKARALMREGVALAEQVFGENHPNLARAWSRYGVRMAAGDQLQEAYDAQHRSRAISVRVFGPEHHFVGVAELNLGHVANHLFRWDEAVMSSTRAVEILAETVGSQSVVTNVARVNLSQALIAIGKLDEANEQLLLAEANYAEQMDADEQLALLASRNMAWLEILRGRYPQARERFERLAAGAIDEREKVLSRAGVGCALAALGEAKRARPLLEAIHSKDALLEGDSQTLNEVTFALAQVRWATGERTSETLDLARAAAAGMRGIGWRIRGETMDAWVTAQSE